MKEKIEQLYIVENKSTTELAEIFKLSWSQDEYTPRFNVVILALSRKWTGGIDDDKKEEESGVMMGSIKSGIWYGSAGANGSWKLGFPMIVFYRIKRRI